MRYLKQSIEKCYLLRLYRGDDIFKSIEKFCHHQGITSGIIHGMGAASEANLGFFDGKTYLENVFTENLEILSLTGNIAEGPIIHLHGVFSRADGTCVGGHIFPGCIVSVTCEVYIMKNTPSPIRLEDPNTGLKLLELPEEVTE